MTREELIKDGWDPKNCLVGTLYFKGRLFCKLKEGKAIVYDQANDMMEIGKAVEVEDFKRIISMSDYYRIKDIEEKLALLKLQFEINNGISYKEYKENIEKGDNNDHGR